MKTWSLQIAKARFSELVSTCLREGAQVVTRRGEAAVVMVPIDEYKSLTAPRGDLASFFLQAPRVELDIKRSRDGERGVEL